MEKKQKIFVGVVVACFSFVFIFALRSFEYQSWWRNDASVWFFDVGQGDAIFIDAKKEMLIDGGPTSIIIEKLTSVLPFWDRQIDFVVSTHPHADHLTGLIDVLRRYGVAEVWESGQEYQTGVADTLFHTSATQSASVFAESTVSLDDSVSVSVVYPFASLEGRSLEDANAGSLVLLVTCYDTKILLMGDLPEDYEMQVAQVVGDIDVLKVAHHGSEHSTSAEFLSVIDPEVAIISVGENKYGHPSDVLLNRLSSFGIETYLTFFNGDIRLICKENNYNIHKY